MIENLKKQKIIEKANNKDFNFTEEELYIITNNQDVLSVIANAINPIIDDLINNNQDYSKYQKTIIKLMDFVPSDLAFKYFNQNTLMLYLCDEIKSQFANYSDLNDAFLESNLTEERRNFVLNYYENLLKTHSYQDITITDKITLIKLLDYKRYDLLKSAKFDFIVPKDLEQRLKTELKENNIKINVDNFKNYSFYADNLELLSFDSLLYVIEDNLENDKSITDIIPYLDKEILNSSDKSLIHLDHDWDKIISSLPLEYEDKIVKKVVNNIKNGSIVREKFSDDYTFDKLYQISYLFEQIAEVLIEKGYLNYVLPTQVGSQYTGKIIELVETDPTYKKKIKLGMTDIKDYKLLNCFIKNGIKYNTNPSLIEPLKEALKQNIIPKIGWGLISPDLELLNLMLKTKDYELLSHINWNSLNYNQLPYETITLFKDAVNNNILVVERIFQQLRNEIASPLLIINNPSILQIILNVSSRFLDEIMAFITHNDGILTNINKDSLELIFTKILEYTSLNKKHLTILKEKFGYEIIIYSQNKNIIDLINLDDEKFDEILNLFLETKYDLQDLKKAYDNIKQYEFSKTNSNIVSIFNNILISLDNNDNTYLEYLKNIESIMDERFYHYFYQNYPDLLTLNISNFDLLLYITDKIKNGKNEEITYYKDILHSITTYYLDRMRGLHKLKSDFYTDLKIPYELEEKSSKTALLHHFITNKNCYLDTQTLFKMFGYSSELVTFQHYLIHKMVSSGIEEELAKEIIYYYTNHEISKNSKYDEKIVRDYIKTMIKIANNGLELISKELTKKTLKDLDKKNKIKRLYQIPSIDINILKILSELNINLIERKMLQDETLYNSLLGTLQKNKPYLLPHCLFTYLNSNNNLHISYDYTDLAAFINYYYSIYEKYLNVLKSNNQEEKVDLNLVDIIINSSLYTTNSLESYILGPDDFRLIKANIGPNSAYKCDTEKRISESVSKTFQNFQRQEVMIPTFNEIITLENDKKIRVVVGNFTNPVNLTHGERTGSCMRIGGAGETLYDFCLDNPFGFHIRFEDVETGKYISRVSGFRNGNTVFLNELRYSCDLEKYLNEDVVLACKMTAELLIEKSKKDNLPIANVVISSDYAMSKTNYQKHQLNVSNIKEGFPSYFYTDVSSFCIVLATNSKDNAFTKVNLDNSQVIPYQPARDTVKRTNLRNEAITNINRVHLVKQKLERDLYEYEEIILAEDLIYAIYNQDFYIYVDKNFEIHSELIEVDERAKGEYQEAMLEIKQVIQEQANKKGDNHYGI